MDILTSVSGDTGKDHPSHAHAERRVFEGVVEGALVVVPDALLREAAVRAEKHGQGHHCTHDPADDHHRL